jgi:hypothetical protein
MGEIEEFLEKVFTEYGQQYVNIIKKSGEEREEKLAELEEWYEEQKEKLKKEYEEKIINAEPEKKYLLEKEYNKKDVELFEEYDSKENEIYNEFDEREVEEVNKLREEVEKRLAEKNMGVEWDYASDKYNYLNITGLTRNRIIERHDIIDKKSRKAYKVLIYFDEVITMYESNIYFEKVIIEEVEWINEEDCPFAYTLNNNIPWLLIRDTWLPNINSFIVDIAKAEKENRLEQELKRILEIVEKGSWVYDYIHFKNSLLKTMQQFNIQISISQ